jgi:hypothetical protein
MQRLVERNRALADLFANDACFAYASSLRQDRSGDGGGDGRDESALSADASQRGTKLSLMPPMPRRALSAVFIAWAQQARMQRAHRTRVQKYLHARAGGDTPAKNLLAHTFRSWRAHINNERERRTRPQLSRMGVDAEYVRRLNAKARREERMNGTEGVPQEEDEDEAKLTALRRSRESAAEKSAAAKKSASGGGSDDGISDAMTNDGDAMPIPPGLGPGGMFSVRFPTRCFDRHVPGLNVPPYTHV